jgi:integrase
MHPLSPDQLAAFLAAARPERLYPLFLTALDSGARQGELFALEWSDLNIIMGEMTISKSLDQNRGKPETKETKTKSGNRRVLLTPSTLAVLREHQEKMLAEGHGSKLVFPNVRGDFLTKSALYDKAWPRVLRKAGIDHLRFHDLRHTCATLLLLAGAHVKVVSERLGHASIEITLKVYSHVLPTMQEAAVEKMEGILTTAAANGSSLAANNQKAKEEKTAVETQTQEKEGFDAA